MREELQSSKKRMKELEQELADSKVDADLYEIDEESGELDSNVHWRLEHYSWPSDCNRAESTEEKIRSFKTHTIFS
eukprot:jgi/Pico_ML_1/56009/g1610.t1